MTNIIVGGFLGSSVGLLFCASRIVALLSSVTDFIRIVVRTSPTFGPWNGDGYGFLLGCLFCFGSKVGLYHSIFLPIILIEMERGETSILGSVDECTLVLVSAGICAANVLTSSDALPRRGLKINVLYGDFIEVAYPYMERSNIVNVSAYLACGLSTEILYRNDPGSVMSSAYFPLPLSILLARDHFRIAFAMFSAFFVSFGGTLLSKLVSSKSTRPGLSEKAE